ncbi:MAG: type I methionyl aminopeptidase [Acidobacteria bacterium]|nr:MAG: type I methionyl aminopeptidase [Acidobacteriota bacterium]REK07119.1 MAG: type I methionyl aminopeptidase [Acidobacteriota bacterium]
MIIRKTPAEIELMNRANEIVHLVHDEMRAMLAPGVSTLDLDRRAEEVVRDHGGIPAFLGYNGFPATLCTSINDVIVHGIPSAEQKLEEGDIIGIDCGVFFKGYCGDSAVTLGVGEISEEARHLLDVTEASLDRAIEAVRPGSHVSDIGHAVQTWVEAHGLTIVRDFVGHGIGSAMHEDPQIPNFGEPGRREKLKPGMVLAIEPMVNVGSAGVKVDADGWTARTADGSLSAHFEYSVAVTERGSRVLGTVPERLSATA